MANQNAEMRITQRAKTANQVAKRLECGQLAAAFHGPWVSESRSKLPAPFRKAGLRDARTRALRLSALFAFFAANQFSSNDSTW